MAFRSYIHDSIGAVRVYKHKSAKNIRLTLGHNDFVRVTVPSWSSYRLGYEFAKSRSKWIEKHHKPKALLNHGDQIGKSQVLSFVPSPELTVVKASQNDSDLIVKMPAGMQISDNQAQTSAQKIVYAALRRQAENLLPQQLAILANKYGYTYQGVTIRRLKARWGSCNQHKDIVLNLQLMQLPWELINYVLMHELAHTKVLRHGPDFWAELTSKLPKARQLQKELRNYQTSL